MTRSSGIRGLTARAAGVLAAALLVAGCEGSNLFEGEVAEEGPEITSLAAPTSVASGEPFTVTATATAPRGVRFVEIRVSGAATDSIRDVFTDVAQTRVVSLQVAGSSALGAQIFIDALVGDVNGRQSPVRRATVSVTAAGTGAPPSN